MAGLVSAIHVFPDDLSYHVVIARSASDEAIQSFCAAQSDWIASLRSQ
jgi:hypothetical protein